MRHARRRIGEMLGQRWQWSSRFGQHHTCGYKCIAHGRQLGCTERGCTHQYRHNNYNDYDYDNNDNNDNYHDNYHDDYNNDGRANNYNNDGRANNYNNFDFDDHNGRTACLHSALYDNNHNGRTNHNIDDFINNASSHGGATAHHQRIRQQHTRVKPRSETATQQTWYAVARRRFRVVRGVSRIQRPQSRQPTHGETVAIGLYLSIGPRPWVSGHPKYAVLPVIPNAEHHC
jgi:hypothetical protein